MFPIIDVKDLIIPARKVVVSIWAPFAFSSSCCIMYCAPLLISLDTTSTEAMGVAGANQEQVCFALARDKSGCSQLTLMYSGQYLHANILCIIRLTYLGLNDSSQQQS